MIPQYFKKAYAITAVLLCVLTGSIVPALAQSDAQGQADAKDQVILKNGDQISGKIQLLYEGDFISITTPYGSRLFLPWHNISSYHRAGEEKQNIILDPSDRYSVVEIDMMAMDPSKQKDHSVPHPKTIEKEVLPEQLPPPPAAESKAAKMAKQDVDPEAEILLAFFPPEDSEADELPAVLVKPDHAAEIVENAMPAQNVEVVAVQSVKIYDTPYGAGLPFGPYLPKPEPLGAPHGPFIEDMPADLQAAKFERDLAAAKKMKYMQPFGEFEDRLSAIEQRINAIENDDAPKANTATAQQQGQPTSSKPAPEKTEMTSAAQPLDQDKQEAVPTSPDDDKDELVVTPHPLFAPLEKQSGSINVGGQLKRGNSEEDRLNVDFNWKLRRTKDRLTIYSENNWNKDGDDVTEDDRQADFTYDYFAGEKWFVQGSLTLQQDDVAELDLRTISGIGLGYQAYESEDLNLQMVGGLNYQTEEFANQGSEEALGLDWSLKYDQRFWEKLTFFHNHDITAPFKDMGAFLLESKTGLKLPILKSIVGTTEVEFDYDNDPAPGTKEEDTIYRVKLGYEW